MLTIYHNPRCSKSRQTLSLLEERGLQPTVVLYLDSPPIPETLENIVKLLGYKPRDLMRTNEEVYARLNLADPNLSDTQLIQAMADHPILIERPIVINGNRAALGRPPEQVLDILE